MQSPLVNDSVCFSCDHFINTTIRLHIKLCYAVLLYFTHSTTDQNLNMWLWYSFICIELHILQVIISDCQPIYIMHFNLISQILVSG